MDGEIVPLRMNIAQKGVHATLEVQRKAGYPMRVIILKARRTGISTYCEGRFFMEINQKANHYACIVSADLDASNKVFKMSKLFQEQIPEGNKRKTVYSNRKEIVYESPHRSEFHVQTVGTDVLGRGGLTHYFHGTEVAFWKNAKEQFGGASQEIPDKQDTIIALESTAFGQGGMFYDMYTEAVEDWKLTQNPANYLPIFLPWFIFPDYQMRIPENIDFQIGVPHAGNMPLEWVADEAELVAKYNLCNEQLFWRRWAIKNKCQSDLSLFFQEYPATWREAFVSTGRQVFLASKLEQMDKLCTKGGFYLFEKIGKGDVQPTSVNQFRNCWQVWSFPKSGYEYAVGVDPMEGTQADRDDPKSGFDYHGAQVFCRTTGEYVAEWHGQGSQRDFGEQCLNAARFYNGAWIAPELPTGLVVLDVLKEALYDRIYVRQRGDEKVTELDSDSLGWRTTILTRPKMIEDLRTAVIEDSVKIYSANLIKEMREFAYNKEGKPIHPPGGHDDLLFGAMIALQLHLRLPMSSKPYEFGTTFESETPTPSTNLSMANVRDTWESPESDEDEDEEYTS
jgi:hypothetical protein